MWRLRHCSHAPIAHCSHVRKLLHSRFLVLSLTNLVACAGVAADSSLDLLCCTTCIILYSPLHCPSPPYLPIHTHQLPTTPPRTPAAPRGTTARDKAVSTHNHPQTPAPSHPPSEGGYFPPQRMSSALGEIVGGVGAGGKSSRRQGKYIWECPRTPPPHGAPFWSSNGP